MRPLACKSGPPVVTALALAALMTTGAFAQGNPAAGGSAATQAHPEMRMSHDAVHIFTDVDMALKALNQGNKVDAQHDLTMAMTERDKLAMTARNYNLPKVVPIYAELDQNTNLGAMMAKKNNNQPVAPANEPVTVDNVKDQLTFVGIDLDKTKMRLQSASQAIRNNNMEAAKDTLSSIGDDLVVAKVDVDAPLLAIRENLALAHVAAASSHPHEATAALQQASGELAAYSQNGGPHQQQAQQLRSGIDQMLGKGTQNQAMSADRIGMWWMQVNSWMQTPQS
jgi:hypothetical protein